MNLSDTMKEALNQVAINWELVNISELDVPVLIVLDYSPSDNQPPHSIAFDCSGAPKCWITASKVCTINGNSPSIHPDYREFCFRNRKFYPYSIQAFSNTIFQDIREFKSACQALYQHADWSDEP